MVKRKIKIPEVDVAISLTKTTEVDYPIFCFKYFQQDTIVGCSEIQVKKFFERLQKLAELGWKEIQRNGRHNYGWELLPINQIKHQLPSIVTPDVEKLYVFRYTNANNPFIALRNGNVLHVLMIEANFGDIYNH